MTIAINSIDDIIDYFESRPGKTGRLFLHFKLVIHFVKFRLRYDKTNSTNSIIFLIFTLSVYAQANDKKFGISLNVNYTSTSQLFLQPKAIDPFIRNTHEILDKITSYSFDIRYQLSESILIGIGSELIEKLLIIRSTGRDKG